MVDIVKRFHNAEREENRRNGETVQNWTVGCGKITTRGMQILHSDLETRS
jgi:hypothetical protein